MKKYIGKIFFAIIIIGSLFYIIKEIPSVFETIGEKTNNSNLINAKNLDYFENFSKGVKDQYYGK